ncbi:MAG: UxaA family hydrolase [Sedimentisphaerales bacterium]
MNKMQLQGYKRLDGRIGFRNYVLVVPLTGCNMEVARRIAAAVPDATCIGHPNGCDLQMDDFALFGNILENFVTHPNVGAVLFLAMGCAASLSLNLPARAVAGGRLCKTLNVVQSGTTRTVEAGVKIVQEMVEELSGMKREPVEFSALVIGTKCGASDANSFAYCHPVVGRACDLLVEKQATVVLAENCELVGGADNLSQRAGTPEIGAKIREMAENVNRGWKNRFGISYEDFALKNTNRQAYIQRSLEHAAKAGSTPFRGFFDMSEIVHGPGLVILDTPNTDLESVTCIAAAGCNVTLFTTGRGTPIGSPASITIKITATERTFINMEENIDICVAGVIDGKETIEQAAERVVETIIKSANGELTKAERLGHWEVAMPIRGVTY